MKLARLLPFLCAFLALSSAGALANTPPTVSASPNPATTDQNTDIAITCIATDTEDTRYWGFYFEGGPDFGIITDLQRPPCTVADGIKTCTAIVTYRPNPNRQFRFQVRRRPRLFRRGKG